VTSYHHDRSGRNTDGVAYLGKEYPVTRSFTRLGCLP